MKKILLILTALVFLCSAGTAFAESGASATYRRLSEQILTVLAVSGNDGCGRIVIMRPVRIRFGIRFGIRIPSGLIPGFVIRLAPGFLPGLVFRLIFRFCTGTRAGQLFQSE